MLKIYCDVMCAFIMSKCSFFFSKKKKCKGFHVKWYQIRTILAILRIYKIGTSATADICLCAYVCFSFFFSCIEIKIITFLLVLFCLFVILLWYDWKLERVILNFSHWDISNQTLFVSLLILVGYIWIILSVLIF